MQLNFSFENVVYVLDECSVDCDVLHFVVFDLIFHAEVGGELTCDVDGLVGRDVYVDFIEPMAF